jgi:hypothetical protein
MNLPAAITYADSVITYLQGGASTDCTGGIPDCHTSLVQTGACANVPVTGMNDMKTWPLSGGDNIVIGFQCSSITEVGIDLASDGAFGPSADFRVWGTVSGNLPSVEVSIDATNYTTVNLWGDYQNQKDQPGFAALGYADFDLESAIQNASSSLTLVRYVRITQNEGGTSAIDAVEAFRGQP